MVLVLIIALVLVSASLLLLVLVQQRMVYPSRRYGKDYIKALSEGVFPLDYRIPQGRQRAYYVNPKESPMGVPGRLWLVLVGNKALALDWLSFAQRSPHGGDGFLLFDYPGYGANEGRASLHTILSSLDGALGALASHIGVELELLRTRLSLIGHSLGAAIALEYALRNPARTIVLIAPFTSMYDMAVRTVGYPLCLFLLHRLDNRRSLRALALRNPKPRVFIFHGDRDTLVPVEMGRELASIDPEMITYIEVGGADHKSVVGVAESYLYGVGARADGK
jgi:pimeloyl-ACP methyl ester carboxylesterase